MTMLVILRLSSTKLTTRPRNMPVVAESDVIFRCSSDLQGGRNASWVRFTQHGRAVLFRSGRTTHPDVDGRRFEVNARDGRGGLELSVRGVRAEDAGLYVCIDDEQRASAHLVVVTSTPTCSVNVSASTCRPTS